MKARKARKAAVAAKLKSSGEKSVVVVSKTVTSSSQAKAVTSVAASSKSIPSKTVTRKSIPSTKVLESSHSSKTAPQDINSNSPVKLKVSRVSFAWSVITHDWSKDKFRVINQFHTNLFLPSGIYSYRLKENPIGAIVYTDSKF